MNLRSARDRLFEAHWDAGLQACADPYDCADPRRPPSRTGVLAEVQGGRCASAARKGSGREANVG